MAEITDYLKGLDEQVVREEKNIEIVRNPSVDLLCKIYKDVFRIVGDYHLDEQDDYWDCYAICETRVGRISYNAKDITDFSTRLKEFENRDNFAGYTGFFLSALVNHCTEKEVTIFTKHLSEPIERLGYMNERNLTIIGDVGNNAGQEMIEGKILITGSAMDKAARSAIGRLAVDGEICIEEGEPPWVSIDCGAKVYHKGVQVWPR